MHGHGAPSNWLTRLAPAPTAGATALDLACGGGRHVRWLAAQGWRVTAIDRDAQAIADLAPLAQTLVADLENAPWPLGDRQFDLVLVTNYLWRPLWQQLRACLAPGAMLIYETFADGQQSVGRPARPDFLLRHGELLEAFRGLRVVAFEDGFECDPPRFVQRLAAVNEASALPEVPRYSLTEPTAKL